MKDQEKRYIKRMGERIREIRKLRGMTQLDVAVKSGMEENAFQRIEAGRTNPSTKTLLRITEALEISMSEFFQFDI